MGNKQVLLYALLGLFALALGVGVLIVWHLEDVYRSIDYRHCTTVVIDSAKCVAP